MTAVVLQLPRYLRSEWAKEAQITRDQGKEPDFPQLTKFVGRKARLANTEYGRLINTRSGVEGENTKVPYSGRNTRKASSFTLSGTIKDGNSSLSGRTPVKQNCIFCEKDGHNIGKCFKFQEKTYDERKSFVSKNGLCNLCLLKGHYVNKCRKTCLVPGCGKRHHPMLHPVSINSNEGGNEIKKDQTQNADRSTQGATAQTGHCGATGTLKKPVCLRIIPVKVSGKDNDVEKLTYAIRDECSNTRLVKESLANELKLKGQAVDFQLTTMNGVSQESGRSYTFYVQGLGQKDCLEIQNALSVKDLSVAKSCIPSKEDIAMWRHFDGISVPELENPEVTVLIGADVPEAHWKLEERRGRKKEPYAVQTPLGWSVAGPLGTNPNNNVSSFHIRKEDEFLRETVDQMLQRDFSESTYSPVLSMSLDDKKALATMKSSLMVDSDGHYQLDLPFREKPNFPNNRSMAERRLRSLKMRLKRDEDLHVKYKAGIDDYVDKGYAAKVKPSEVSNAGNESVWYLPHHPVLHPQKPSKPRIVFDCAAKYEDVSLNDELLQGPDMTNTLVGVLIRFRQDPIAFLADIEAMFCQVRVSPEHRKFLKFLWSKDGNLEQEPEGYDMLVHLFGATSSPSCAGFCLRKVAEEFEGEFDAETIQTIRKNFYVDDCLKSLRCTEKAIQMIQELCHILAKRSFRLTKFVCNDVRVLSSIPESERAKSIVSLDFDELPVERALGVEWNVKEDVFGFERKKAATRRGILSDVSSMYDPLGFAAPFVLPAKRLLRKLCKDKIGWDEEISPSMLQVWERWLNDMPRLRNIKVPRYFESCKMGPLKTTTQLHHFCDASFDGYGAVSYLRFEDVDDRVNCALVMAKSRVAPIKPTTIPRLELTAATVAVKQYRQINQELDLKVDSVTFWTDSTCVLRYINSESNRFKTFVANRIALIHDLSSPTSWRYVSSKDNPADYASRGLRPTDTHEIDQWINGPDFLRGKEDDWPSCSKDINVLPDEALEWKKEATIYETQIQHVKPLDIFIQHYSSWYRLLKGIAWLTRFVCYLCATHRDKYAAREVPRSSRPSSVGDHTGAGVDPLSVEELRSAKKSVVRYVQCECFPDEVAHLKPTQSDRSNRRVVKKSSKLATLSPFMGEDNLIRVGGRLERAEIPFDAKHPIIIPSKHHIVGLLIRHYHEREGHSGVRAVLAAIQQDLWILQGRSRIRYIIDQCIICRKKYEQPCEQMMASLPTPRVTAFERLFSSTGVDYFGPFLVKRGRCQVKRYGCIFTCLAMRAVHIEVAQSLDAESFLCAFSRFTARRGLPKAIYSDNGSNFVAGSRILEEEFEKIKCDEAQLKIHHSLRAKEFSWYFNPPLASHNGGIWERMIRSVRQILAAVMNQQVVDDEAFHTFIVEVERILNNRPLLRNTNQPDDLDPLTPSKLLLLYSNSCVPPGVFVDTDRYNKRWRQAQLLANTFWKRWIKEYLPTLQRRQKWLQQKRNLSVKDLVLMVDKDCPRGKWPMAVVEEVFPDEKGIVRHVRVRTTGATFKRDVRELCLLEGDANNDS